MLGAITLASCAYTALTAPLAGDYVGSPSRGLDFAGAPIQALASGHVGRFFAVEPMMGSVTLLLRAPVVAVSRALGAGLLWQYRLGCLACLLVAAALIWIAFAVALPTDRKATLLAQARTWTGKAAMLVAVLAGPVMAKALYWGHPEEIVGAALCVLAVLLATRCQPVAAGICLGLALATKQWALLAVLPTVIAAPSGRVRLLGAATVVGALLIGPMLIADPGLFIYQNVHAGMALGRATWAPVTPTNLLFPFSSIFSITIAGTTSSTYVIPRAVETWSHPVAIVVGLGLPLLWWWRVRDRGAGDVLLVLTLALLARCLLDPLALSYHHVPFVVALASWELFQRRRFPIVSLLTAAAFYAIGRWFSPATDLVSLNHAYLAWAFPVLGYLLFMAARHLVQAASPAAATDNGLPVAVRAA